MASLCSNLTFSLSTCCFLCKKENFTLFISKCVKLCPIHQQFVHLGVNAVSMGPHLGTFNQNTKMILVYNILSGRR